MSGTHQCYYGSFLVNQQASVEDIPFSSHKVLKVAADEGLYHLAVNHNGPQIKLKKLTTCRKSFYSVVYHVAVRISYLKC